MRTVLLVVSFLGAAALAIVGGRALRRSENAAALVREAENVLAPPFARVPELSAIAAHRAISLLREASALSDQKELRGLLAYATALDEHQKGRAGHARTALREALKLPAPGDRIALLAAAIEHAAGETERAAGLLEHALARSPNDPRVRVLAVDVALEAGDAARARTLLDALIAAHGELGPLLDRRGLVREQQGDTQGALADFERAAARAVQSPAPQLNRGRLLLREGDPVAAEEAFTLAIERGAGYEAWLGRGLSRQRQGDLSGARVDVVRARELGTAQPGPLLALGDLDAHAGELAAAIEHYRAALLLDGADAAAWLKLGNALTRTRAHAQARSAYERALALSPSMSAAHNGLGAALMYLGDRKGAELALARAAELDVADPNPLLNLALLRERAGDRRGAHAARARAAERAPARVN